MPDILDELRIKHEDPKYEPMLNNMQGNILKGHDRDHVVLLFLRFRSDEDPSGITKRKIRERIRQWGSYVTSAKIQLDEWKLYHFNKIPGGTFVNFFLSRKGYESLGFHFLEAKGFDSHFLEGMQNFSADLNDPDPQTWEDGYRQDLLMNQIHALLLIADDDPAILGQKVRLLLRDIIKTENDDTLADIVKVERGKVIRREVLGVMQPVEHFGFVDGISNPQFLESDREERVTKLGGESEWQPWAPLRVALVKDPLGPNEWSFGSYLVYRKLEQDVRGFVYRQMELASALFNRPISEYSCPELDEQKWQQINTAGALAMGRFWNGTPITKSTELGSDLRYEIQLSNNFNYKNDKGERCPLHAHIRRANNRSEPEKGQDQRPRIVRRGITYGERAQNLNEILGDLPPNSKGQTAGLLFMCFQSNIRDQYEFIQKSMNNMAESGRDPVTGQRKPLKDGEQEDKQEWPVPLTKKPVKKAKLACHDFVALKGGEYFFAPSISFLKNI